MIAAAVTPSSVRAIAGQRLAACSNGQRTTMKSKSTYQARFWEGRRPGAAVLGVPAGPPTTAGRALAPHGKDWSQSSWHRLLLATSPCHAA